MLLRYVSIVWVGGNAADVRIELYNGATYIGAGATPVQREGMPAPFEFEIIGSPDAGPVEVNRALVSLMNTTQGGHKVRFHDSQGRYWDYALPASPVSGGWGVGIDLPDAGDTEPPAKPINWLPWLLIGAFGIMLLRRKK